MSMGSTRVLRERKPSRPQSQGYQTTLHQPAHSLPQAYGTEMYQDNHGYPASENSTSYTSPASSAWMPDDSSVAYGGIDYESGGPRYVGNMALRSYGRGTPPTPARSDVSIVDPRFAGQARWSRSASTARGKPKKQKKKEKITAQSIMPGDVPVPILSHDCEGPIHEISKFVHRPIETRIKEVAGKNGYTPRPMNNFMLYRKAYQDKAKKVSSQTNHQVVSVVVAASWKTESKEIKDKFARFAQIEKEHHIQAFPNYQFRPNKSNKARKRKAGEYDVDESEPEDEAWSQPARPTKKTKQDMHTVPGNYTPESHHQYLQMPQVSQPYSQTEYAVDYQGQPMYYAQPEWNSYPETDWPATAQYQGQTTQSFSTGALSGLPGGGNALLNPDFTNAIFDPPAGASQSSLLHHGSDHGPGAFTQSAFEALDDVAASGGWGTYRASMDGKTLTAAFPATPAEFNQEYFS